MPAVPPADPIPTGQEGLNSYGFDFTRLGVRVPAVVVSPFIPRGTVDHTIYDHTSVLATVERMLGMAPLTERDKAANDVWHLLHGAARLDCPERLPDPAPVQDPPSALAGRDSHGDEVALPGGGNLIGFLHVLLKEEMALAEKAGDTAGAEILAEFRAISTHRQACDYARRMKQRLDDAVG